MADNEANYIWSLPSVAASVQEHLLRTHPPLGQPSKQRLEYRQLTHLSLYRSNPTKDSKDTEFIYVFPIASNY
jgi:hypothetical protein